MTLGLPDYQAEVGFYLGFSRIAANWTSDQLAAINSCVNSGVRQFYYPTMVEGGPEVYDWSFIHPTAKLNVPNNVGSILLPDDFAGIEDQITVLSTMTQVTWPLDIVGEGRVRQAYEITPNTTGRPLFAAISWLKGTTPGIGQRAQLVFYPLTDQAYVFQVAYYVLPDALTAQLAYAYGGMAHVETILESCLAVAEARLDDSQTVHANRFQERLRASINLDRKNKPSTLGYNRDLSDWRERWQRGDLHGWSLVSVYGTVH